MQCNNYNLLKVYLSMTMLSVFVITNAILLHLGMARIDLEAMKQTFLSSDL
jgi:hypothetical protein